MGVALPALSALEEGREVYVVADASAGATPQAHRLGIQRVTQAGGVPLTWLQLLGEFQSDWAREETRAAVEEIVRDHEGSRSRGARLVRDGFARGAGEGAP
ncbi:isochorismatase family protein [Streptomyces sp. NPDC053474]|uniref:isochorismatase family protein n=1 Tax=Streptomyces sp. NPDC053474 TaxID=3365704 RepID=UPI0037CEE677